MLSLLVRVDLEVTAVKEYSILPRFQELEILHKMKYYAPGYYSSARDIYILF